MSKFISFPRSYRAVGTSVLLHLLLLLLLLAGLYVTHHPLSYDMAQDESLENPAPVVIIDDPGDRNAQQEEAANPQPVAEAIQRAIEPMQELVQEVMPQEQPVIQNTQPVAPVRRRSAEQARNAWRAKPVEPEKIESAENEEPDALLSKRKKFGRALSSLEYKPEDRDYDDAYRMGRKKTDRTGSDLTEKINGEFSQDAIKNYHATIMRAICYAMNKARIMAAYSDWPQTVVIRVTIQRTGDILHVELLRGSHSPLLNERVIAAVKSASPLREAPRQITEDPFKFTCYIHAREDRYNGRSIDEKTLTVFYFDGKGVY